MRWLAPAWERSVERGEHKPSAWPQGFADDCYGAVEIIDIGKPEVTSHSVDIRAIRSYVTRYVSVEVADAEREGSFSGKGFYDEFFGDIDACDSGTAPGDLAGDTIRVR